VRNLIAIASFLVLSLSSVAAAHGHHHASDGAPGLADATVLIVRHAEDAATGPGLSEAGQQRARAYARYFRPFRFGQASLHIDTLIAAADSRHSQRPRLTLEPLSQASGLPIEHSFKDRDVKDLVRWLGQGQGGRTVLISWHHSEVPKLIHDLGLDPTALLHHGHWPSHEYGQVVMLRFDHSGAVMAQACVLIQEPTSLE
jgi:hypothetical protein